jgi:hypothetical protein
MSEKAIVSAVVNALEGKGFKVATEVANFYRSADVGAVDCEGNVWVVECKVSNIGRAIEQAKIHRLAANKVFVATGQKKLREVSLSKIRKAGLGLLYVMEDGSISEAIGEPYSNEPWELARRELLERIMEWN